MAYAIMRLEKVKTAKELASRYQHNFRIYHVDNADPSRTHLNFEPVDLMGKTYERAVNEEITRFQMEGTIQRKCRGDAVKGFEIMLGYSYGHELDLDKWVEKSVEWLNKTFNPKDSKVVIQNADGNIREIPTDNVKSVVVHMDEESPHIHAFVVPIDDKGHLNAKYYTTNRNIMVQLQTDYAKAMKEFGLKRGVEKTTASHQQMAQYHQKAKDCVTANLPDPLPGETVQEYKLRADDVYRTEKVHHAEDVRKLEQKKHELYGKLAQIQESQTQEQTKSGRQIIKLCSELGIEDASPERIKESRRMITQMRNFEEAVQNYPDREYAEQVYQQYQDLARWERKRKKEKKKYKD